MKLKAICLILSILFLARTASAVELCGDKIQGGLLLGHAPGAAKVIFNDKTLTVSPRGDFLIAFGRDQQPEQSLIIDGKQYSFDIAKRQWETQSITGLPPKTVAPGAGDQAAIEREHSDLHQALIAKNPTSFWQNGFIMPVEGRTSGSFGNQRIMNGQPKNPHQGLDIAAPEGTKVQAAGDGIVRLAGHDYFYTGNVVVIDHGYNLTTIYAHLKEIKVKQGDIITQGAIIGTVGKTGRVTGPHLHWGASLNGSRFDPLALLGLKNDKKCFQLP